MKLLLLSDALTSKLPRSIPWLALHQSWVVSVGCQCLSSLLTLERRGVFQLRLVRGPSLWWSSCWNLLEAFDGAVFQQSLDEGYRIFRWIKDDKGFWGRGPLLAPSYIHA